MIMLDGKPLDLTIYIIINKNMCGLKDAQIHERPFRAAKDHVLPLSALDSFLPSNQKDLISRCLSSMVSSLYEIIVAHILYPGMINQSEIKSFLP